MKRAWVSSVDELAATLRDMSQQIKSLWKAVNSTARSNQQDSSGRVVAIGSLKPNFTLTGTIGATAPMTNVLPFTMQLGRRYAIQLNLRAVGAVGAVVGDHAFNMQLREGATMLGNLEIWHIVRGNYSGRMFEWMLNGDGIQRNLHVEAVNASGVGLNMFTEEPSFFRIIDLGPSVSPALPEQATAPLWEPVGLINSWVEYGTPWMPLMMQRVGDRRYLSGLIRNTGASPNLAFANLAAGDRPRPGRSVIFPAFVEHVSGTTGICRLDVSSSGSLSFVYVPTPASGVAYATVQANYSVA